MSVTGTPPEDTLQPLRYPKAVFYILGNEFCERYSFYGLQIILSLFLRNLLHYEEVDAIMIVHVFGFLCYNLPIFGGVLADSYIGKYKTIIYASLIHGAGNVIVALSATPWVFSPRVFALVGLLLTAVGVGLLKPCVTPFGGEQFVLPQQAKELASFFSVVFLFVNTGSLISSILGPILRQNVKCFGQESCYSFAFAVPAVLMILSLVLFVGGKPLYKMKNPESNILANGLKCIFYALRKKLFSDKTDKKPSHWLDYAGEKFDPQLVKDVKEALSVLLMLLPLPLYAALYCQQASRMDGVVGNWFTIQPDQLIVLTPLNTVLLIPLFEVAIYPMLAKIGITRPLQIIVIGGLLCASSFIMAAYVEYKLEPSYAKLPAPGLGQLRIFNSLPCQVELDPPVNGRYVIPTVGALEWTDIPVKGNRSIVERLTLNPDVPCSNIEDNKNWTRDISIFEEEVSGRNDVTTIDVKVVHNLDGPLSLRSQFDVEFIFQLHASDIVTRLNDLASGSYRVTYGYETIISSLEIKSGGVYTLVLQQIDSSIVGSLHTITQPATLHILWEIPQKLTINISGIFLLITYYSFAFTQVPGSMKSIMHSLLLASQSFGEALVVFIAKMRFFHRQTYQFLFYAALMLLDVVLLIFLSIRYKYKAAEKSVPIENESQRDEGGNTEYDVIKAGTDEKKSEHGKRLDV